MYSLVDDIIYPSRYYHVVFFQFFPVTKGQISQYHRTSYKIMSHHLIFVCIYVYHLIWYIYICHIRYIIYIFHIISYHFIYIYVWCIYIYLDIPYICHLALTIRRTSSAPSPWPVWRPPCAWITWSVRWGSSTWRDGRYRRWSHGGGQRWKG